MKIAITGASGWVGRSAYFGISNYLESIPNSSIQLFGRSAKRIETIDGQILNIENIERIGDYEIDIYIPLAFPTQDKYLSLGRVLYEEACKKIIQNDLSVISARPDLKVLLISSGVVTNPSIFHQSNDSYMKYAEMKKFQEDQISQNVTTSNLLTCYLYSCTSRDAYKFSDYAVTSLVEKALNDQTLDISNNASVIRRYIDLRQMFVILMNLIMEEKVNRIESAGELININSLCEVIINTVSSNSKIEHSNSINVEDVYVCKNDDMNRFARDYGVDLMDIRTQILNIKDAINFSKY